MSSVQRRQVGRRRAAAGFLLAMTVVATVGAAFGPARATGAPATSSAASTAGVGTVIPGAYVVTLRSGDPAAVAAEHARLGVRVGSVLSAALNGYTARMGAGLAREVAADPRVSSVVADRAVTALTGGDSRSAAFLRVAASPENAQTTPSGVTRVGAADSSTKAGDGEGSVDADIAVLDTGIDLDHPDLTVAGGVNCVPGDKSYDDKRGHGTHMAGIAAARDNGTGVVGVAPGARVWAVRVLDEQGNGSLSTLLCGIEWVTDHADVIDVANMSLTGRDVDRGCEDGALHQAICASVEAGVTYTVAAGNSGSDARYFTPAAYPEVITVSALADFDGLPGALASTPSRCRGGDDDEFAEFSNFGSPVDLLAPGVCIRGPWLEGAYATLTGSSQSAAHVAGAAALYVSANGNATPAEVRDALVDAGSTSWLTGTDPDGEPEPLLDVSSF